MLKHLVKPEVIAFIKEHTNSDLNRLILNKNKYPGIPVDLAVDQIRAREKAYSKLPLWAETEGVIMPPLLSMEQCSSEQTASYKAGLVSGRVAIDLTGGAGVDSFYFSKHFDIVHYVEQDKELAKIARHNFSLLGAHNIEVHTTTSEAFLTGFTANADLIYIDPARRDQQQKVFRFESCSPNILLLQEELLAKAKKVMVKASPMLDIAQGIQQQASVCEVHVVAIKNEVKELLFIQGTSSEQNIHVKAIDLTQLFTFQYVWGEHHAPEIGPITKYVYEPDSSILKSGGVNWLTQLYPVQKLHMNTHLFTSQELVSEFPGRIFQVKHVVKYNKKELLKYVPVAKANVAVRNFPDSVEVFRKKTGIKPGGNHYLFGATDMEGKVQVIICQKVV